MESFWDKTIRLSAKCDKVVFDNVKINPFYLATKCADKSTLDLTRATLTDNWSKLRKKYAGVNLFIVLVLTFIFFLPLLTQSFFLLLSSKIDASLLPFQRVPLWEALLFGGKVGNAAVLYCSLTIVLIVYNITRFLMTLSIARLREEESFLRDSNFQLVSIHPEKYKTQLVIDKVLKILLWLSIIYSGLKLYDTLQIQVPLFH